MQTYIVSLQKIVCEKGDTLKLAGSAGSIEGCGAAAERGGGLLHGGGGEGAEGGGRRGKEVGRGGGGHLLGPEARHQTNVRVTLQIPLNPDKFTESDLDHLDI